VTPARFRSLGQPETRFADEKNRDPVECAKRRPVLAGMESYFDLVRSTKIEAPPIGLWPKFFSVTVTGDWV